MKGNFKNKSNKNDNPRSVFSGVGPFLIDDGED